MTKPQFSNVCVGAEVRNLTTGIHYRGRARIMRTLVLERISAVVSAPLVEIALLSEHADWEIVTTDAVTPVLVKAGGTR